MRNCSAARPGARVLHLHLKSRTGPRDHIRRPMCAARFIPPPSARPPPHPALYRFLFFFFPFLSLPSGCSAKEQRWLLSRKFILYRDSMIVARVGGAKRFQRILAGEGKQRRENNFHANGSGECLDAFPANAATSALKRERVRAFFPFQTSLNDKLVSKKKVILLEREG